jgi:hypothetical protein
VFLLRARRELGGGPRVRGDRSPGCSCWTVSAGWPTTGPSTTRGTRTACARATRAALRRPGRRRGPMGGRTGGVQWIAAIAGWSASAVAPVPVHSGWSSEISARSRGR